jgi:predicted nucleotidyltransferase
VINPDLGPPLKLSRLLEVLDRHAVDFIVIGGIAGIIHGSAHPTYDFDVLYARDRKNLERMAAALKELDVTLVNAPADLPFQIDARTLAAGSNFTFESDLGRFDILGHAEGMRDYETMRADAISEHLWGIPVRAASIDDLVRMKKTAGRPKDRDMVEELTSLAEDQRRAAKGEKGRPS